MRTAAATEARMRVVDQRMAERLESRGWKVTPPRPPADPDNPCAAGCTDPEAHAEGGHDV